MKKHLLNIPFLFALLFLINCSSDDTLIDNTANNSSEWNYENTNWGETCNCGKSQSPINITGYTLGTQNYNLTFDYKDGDVEEIMDNGHTLEFVFKEGAYATFNGKKYHLKQFHAHHRSEHTVSGISYPMELHFVHTADDGTNLVVAVFIKEGIEDNLAFETLNVFKDLKKNQAINVDIQFDPENIYPKERGYYYYGGSLTTPPCTENVSWVIFSQATALTSTEIHEIEDHLPYLNNRPLQALNGRVIEKY
ncbi:carbonic anhydrase [Apibacter sp. HY039]|uniref:carbonic anhydrase n=1 Tax=Apibacter sp. HY039 TaxID=2501476 RepID=UPI000FEB6FDB|nr:carbonic anhydrase family protein [Apibacter sp. HY039]